MYFKIYMYIPAINKKEATNLKESAAVYVGKFVKKKGRRKYVIIL